MDGWTDGWKDTYTPWLLLNLASTHRDFLLLRVKATGNGGFDLRKGKLAQPLGLPFCPFMSAFPTITHMWRIKSNKSKDGNYYLPACAVALSFTDVFVSMICNVCPIMGCRKGPSTMSLRMIICNFLQNKREAACLFCTFYTLYKTFWNSLMPCLPFLAAQQGFLFQ